MCHTGGPRCDTGLGAAKRAYKTAKKNHGQEPTAENKFAMDQAALDILTTPKNIEKIMKKDPVKGKMLQERYDTLLAGATEYENLSKDLKAEEKNLTASLSDAESKGEDTSVIVDQLKTIQKAQTDALAARKERKPAEFNRYMPEAFAKYFADTEKKHFSEDSVGSTFTEAKNLNEVMALALAQRQTLTGDDRDKLIAAGADPSSFTPDKRYLAVETKGVLGAVESSQLSDNEMLTVERKSDKAKPVCVARVGMQPPTNIATVVLVDNPTLPGTQHTSTLLITAFPGVSGKSGSNEDLAPYIGKQISVADARKIFGREFSVNTVYDPAVAARLHAQRLAMDQAHEFELEQELDDHYARTHAQRVTKERSIKLKQDAIAALREDRRRNPTHADMMLEDDIASSWGEASRNNL